MEKQYLSDPQNLDIKRAYLEQLAHKKAHMDMEEMFAWQNIGILNFKEPKSLTNNTYQDRIEDKLKQIKTNFNQDVKTRMLTIDERPLLMYDGSQITTDDETQLSVIQDKALARLDDRISPILQIAKDKEELLAKTSKIRFYEKIKEVKSESVQVFLYQDDKILTCFFCNPAPDNQANIELDTKYNKLTI